MCQPIRCDDSAKRSERECSLEIPNVQMEKRGPARAIHLPPLQSLDLHRLYQGQDLYYLGLSTD